MFSKLTVQRVGHRAYQLCARVVPYLILGATIFWAAQHAYAAGDPTSLQPALRPELPVPVPAPAAPLVNLGNQPQGSSPTSSPTLQATLSEQQALDTTLLQGPRAAAARLQLGISKALTIQAKIYPNPAAEFDMGFAELSYRGGIAMAVQAPWKMVQRILAAKAQIGVANIQMLQALWLLRADIRRAYTELVIAQESAVMMRNLASLTKDLADVASKRFQAGDVAKLDTLKADLARTQADVDASQADRRVIQAREQLNIIMGRDEAVPLNVPKLSQFQLRAEKNESDLLPDLSAPLSPESQYIADAMKNRLEIKFVNQEIKAAAATRSVVRGNILPDGQISVGYDRQLNSPPETNKNKAYLMGSFPIPIFDHQQGELARLRATIEQLNSELIAQRNIIRGEVALAYRKVLNSRENIRKYQEIVLGQSEKVAELGRLSYRLGQTDITAALTAQQSNIQVRNQYLIEVLNYQQAFTDLEQAIGHTLR